MKKKRNVIHTISVHDLTHKINEFLAKYIIGITGDSIQRIQKTLNDLTPDFPSCKVLNNFKSVDSPKDYTLST